MLQRKNKIDRFINDYCKENTITLVINPKVFKNNGLCYTHLKEIHLSTRYTNQQIKLAIFLHEVSHIRIEQFKSQPCNGFECEHYTWYEAIKLHKKYFNKSFSKIQTEFMLSCLKSYCKNKYMFNKTSYKKEE